MASAGKRRAHRAKSKRPVENKRPAINIWLIVGVVSLLAATVIYISLSQSNPEGIGQYGDYPSDWVIGNSLGNPDAPVTIQAWDDFL